MTKQNATTDNIQLPSTASKDKLIYTKIGVPFLCYEDWVAYMQALGVTCRARWLDYCNTNERPNFLPKAPNDFYGNRGVWQGWAILDTRAIMISQDENENISSRSNTWVSYKTAKTYAQKVGIKTMAEWFSYHRQHLRPKNIPADRRSFYIRQNEWKSWNSFLGTKTLYNYRKDGGLERVKKWFKKNKITSSVQFYQLVKDNFLPDYVPRAGFHFGHDLAKQQF